MLSQKMACLAQRLCKSGQGSFVSSVSPLQTLATLGACLPLCHSASQAPVISEHCTPTVGQAPYAWMMMGFEPGQHEGGAPPPDSAAASGPSLGLSSQKNRVKSEPLCQAFGLHSWM